MFNKLSKLDITYLVLFIASLAFLYFSMVSIG
ncbi:hypothetical protein HBHAL_3133 [Halobacillus halophilus DSM 2266]|uniref:Uncharacterized protein n=1 Tax=Halobacillus halophilus (strain ATCC 35676 / DSM 2266 / JCM 20832 / KCTC 3685 / LMG 17431 / NBRC 102448 / NCIMB 2269) TaxID=866895 RepID=I0JMW0_HALH3|nr:hypothetical protein HBHAL_3133 [Halobacillus halophilus DSM 2266]